MKKAILKMKTIGAVAIAAIAVTTTSCAADTSTNKTAASPAMAPAPAASETEGPAKFYGPVSAVDAAAKTLTVGDQTYTVTGESQVTKDGKPATLADAVVGEPARGSFTKSKDGKLEVTKLRFGKAGGK